MSGDRALTPGQMTDLETLAEHLEGRAMLPLRRAGYTTVESVASATDDDLLALPQVGPTNVSRIRRAVRNVIGDDAAHAAAATHSNRYVPSGRPPIGQYRVSLFLTGDAVGPAALDWALRNAARGIDMTGYVEHIDTIREGDTRYDTPTPGGDPTATVHADDTHPAEITTWLRAELANRFRFVMGVTEDDVPDALAACALRVIAVGTHHPHRGSDVEAFLKRHRNHHAGHCPEWDAINTVLDAYRDGADTGTPLTQDAPSGPNEQD